MMDQKEIINKYIEIDQIYLDFKYSSLERIILNSFKKYNRNDLRSNYIIESSIKSINRIYKADKSSNKRIRALKEWLFNKLNESDSIELCSVILKM